MAGAVKAYVSGRARDGEYAPLLSLAATYLSACRMGLTVTLVDITPFEFQAMDLLSAEFERVGALPKPDLAWKRAE